MYGKIFKTSFIFIFFAELLSIFAYLLPDFNKAAFLIIGLFFFTLSVYRLEYGVLVLLAELFIGSKGYLFYFDFGGTTISIRILFWMILMSIWLVKIINRTAKTKTNPFLFYYKNKYFRYFSVLFVFIIIALINGGKNNDFNNLFFDFNAWLYFALIFPIFESARRHDKFLARVKEVFISSTLWVSLKTFALFYFFTHNVAGVIEPLYKWVRTSGVGEITTMNSGFTRIFFQSHIFVLTGFFVFLFLLTDYFSKKNKNNLLKLEKQEIYNLLIFILFISVNLISYSRSNWVGWILGLFVSVAVIVWFYGLKTFFKGFLLLAFSTVAGILFMTAVAKFPYPNANFAFNAADVLTERAGQVKNEAGASSRWSLLPELWREIKEKPFLGSGFGATVTYKSSDPRVLESSPDGTYTTYAFEWGWLDIWLKLGFFGVLSYLVLLWVLIKDYFVCLKKRIDDSKDFEALFNTGLIIGLISILSLSFFSPYMNHPLGIGFLLILASIISTVNPCQN